MITVQSEAQHIPAERTDCIWDLRTSLVLNISVNQVNSAYLTAPQYTLQRCAAVCVYIYLYMCRGRWKTAHRCTSAIAIFSHFLTGWLWLILQRVTTSYYLIRHILCPCCSDPEAALQQQHGWTPLPLAISSWICGVPASEQQGDATVWQEQCACTTGNCLSPLDHFYTWIWNSVEVISSKKSPSSWLFSEGWHGGRPGLPLSAPERWHHDPEVDAQSADERLRGRPGLRTQVRTDPAADELWLTANVSVCKAWRLTNTNSPPLITWRLFCFLEDK